MRPFPRSGWVRRVLRTQRGGPPPARTALAVHAASPAVTVRRGTLMSAVRRKPIVAVSVAVLAIAATSAALVFVLRSRSTPDDGLFVLKTWTRKDGSVTP